VAEIGSSTDYLCINRIYSLVNQMILTVRVQVFRERRANPRRRMIWKKRALASDEVTSPSSEIIVQQTVRPKRTANLFPLKEFDKINITTILIGSVH